MERGFLVEILGVLSGIVSTDGNALVTNRWKCDVLHSYILVHSRELLKKYLNAEQPSK